MATRLIDKSRKFELLERLTDTKLTTLEMRAIRGDLFKIMNGWDRVQESDFFRRDESGRRRQIV